MGSEQEPEQKREPIEPKMLDVTQQHCICTHGRNDHRGLDEGPCMFCMCPGYKPVGHVWYPVRKNLPQPFVNAATALIDNMPYGDLDTNKPNEVNQYRVTLPLYGSTKYHFVIGIQCLRMANKDPDERR